MVTRKPFSPRQGSSRVIAGGAAQTLTLNPYRDETVRITVIGGVNSIMVRIDPNSAGAGTATSVVDKAGDTPVLINTSLLLATGSEPFFLSIGPGPEGTNTGTIVIQTGNGGVV